MRSRARSASASCPARDATRAASLRRRRARRGSRRLRHGRRGAGRRPRAPHRRPPARGGVADRRGRRRAATPLDPPGHGPSERSLSRAPAVPRRSRTRPSRRWSASKHPTPTGPATATPARRHGASGQRCREAGAPCPGRCPHRRSRRTGTQAPTRRRAWSAPPAPPARRQALHARSARVPGGTRRAPQCVTCATRDGRRGVGGCRPNTSSDHRAHAR